MKNKNKPSQSTFPSKALAMFLYRHLAPRRILRTQLFSICFAFLSGARALIAPAGCLLTTLAILMAGENTFALTPLVGIAKIAASPLNTKCALTIIGETKCWGNNVFGQLGDNSNINRPTPVTFSPLTSGVSAIEPGQFHTCALINGSVKCLGENSLGQLGDNSNTNRLTLADVSGLASGVNAIAAGAYHTCALTSGGGVKCWGFNQYGQLGDNSITNRLTPVDVVGLTSGVSAIALGIFHTCALTNGGGVKCWGRNADGQLGDDSTIQRNTPVDVIGLSAGVNSVAPGSNHTCALTSGGGVKCWGRNLNGELGDGSGTQHNTSVNVSGLTSGASALAVGYAHSCALTTTGGVKCWGSNSNGQLGDDSTTDHITPMDTFGLASGVTGIAAGNLNTCALAGVDGGVKCWGSNFVGELGDNSTTQRLKPVDVLMLAPLVLNTVQSRKTHGGAGTFGLSVDSMQVIGGLVTVEPRTIGAGHQIVFQFNGPVNLPGIAGAVYSGLFDIGTTNAALNPLANNEVIVTLTGIQDNRRVTVSLFGVNGTTNASASIGFLVGDVNGMRSVNSSDISGVKARSGQTTDALNFKFDVNASGTVNSSDISAVKARSGLVLAP